MAMEMDEIVNVGLGEATKGLYAVGKKTTINLSDEDAMVIDLLCSLEKSINEMSDDDVDILEEH
jgi:hypothetical protein